MGQLGLPLITSKACFWLGCWLQAFERQVDNLSRQLAKAEAESEELVREREVMLEELRAAQQVRYHDNIMEFLMVNQYGNWVVPWQRAQQP